MYYTQSVLVPSSFGRSGAIQWVLSHGYLVTKEPHLTAHFYRFRQRAAEKPPGARARTVRFANGVELVNYYY